MGVKGMVGQGGRFEWLRGKLRQLDQPKETPEAKSVLDFQRLIDPVGDIATIQKAAQAVETNLGERLRNLRIAVTSLGFEHKRTSGGADFYYVQVKVSEEGSPKFIWINVLTRVETYSENTPSCPTDFHFALKVGEVQKLIVDGLRLDSM